MTDPMTIDVFRKLDREGRASRPKAFLLASPDRPATPIALRELERVVGAKLPHSYREFLIEFGGGSYGLTTVFSADPQSECYIAARFDEPRPSLPTGLLPFSDDFAGGLYAFEIVDGQAREPVLYWNTDGGTRKTQFGNALEFIAQYAYQAA